MIDSLLSGNIFGIVRHNFWDLTLIFWSLKHTLRMITHILTKTVCPLSAQTLHTVHTPRSPSHTTSYKLIQQIHNSATVNDWDWGEDYHSRQAAGNTVYFHCMFSALKCMEYRVLCCLDYGSGPCIAGLRWKLGQAMLGNIEKWRNFWPELSNI